MPGPVTSTTSVAAEMEATAFSASRACPLGTPSVSTGESMQPASSSSAPARTPARKFRRMRLLLHRDLGAGRHAAEGRHDPGGARGVPGDGAGGATSMVGTLDAQLICGLTTATPLSLAEAV